MIKIFSLQNHHLIELNAKGVVRKGDYEKLDPIVENKIRKFGKTRLMINIGSLNGVKLLAFWEDFKMSLKYANRCEKIAVFGYSKPESILTKPFAPLVSTDIKLFKNKTRAKHWISN